MTKPGDETDLASEERPRTRRAIPTMAYVRLCERIEPEASDSSLVVGLEHRYDTLTLSLPLAGGEALRPTGEDGVPALTRFLMGEAPWLGSAIDRIDAQLRLQLWAGRPWIAFRPLLLVGWRAAASRTWRVSSPSTPAPAMPCSTLPA